MLYVLCRRLCMSGLGRRRRRCRVGRRFAGGARARERRGEISWIRRLVEAGAFRTRKGDGSRSRRSVEGGSSCEVLAFFAIDEDQGASDSWDQCLLCLCLSSSPFVTLAAVRFLEMASRSLRLEGLKVLCRRFGFSSHGPSYSFSKL